MQFDDFAGITQEEWKQLILKTIKAETQEEKLHFYAQKLIQHPEPGIEIQPFYTKEDLTGLEYLQGFHQLWAQTRQTTGWINVGHINPYFLSPTECHNDIHYLFNRGAEGVNISTIQFQIANSNTKPDWSIFLHTISLEKTPIFFSITDPIQPFLDFLKNSYPDISRLMGGIYYTSDSNNVLESYAAILHVLQNAPYFQLILSPKENSTTTETLFNLLEQAKTLVKDLSLYGMSPSTILPKIGFGIDIKNDYFLEIAKLRALRLLWWQFGQMYDPSLNMIDVFIYAHTSSNTNIEEEPYQTLLSHTTQAMSGIIGGCDALTIYTYPNTDLKEFELRRRIALNISSILKEESYFDKVVDIGAGSYLIENLTHQIAKMVWERLSV
ncbi:methylmalonyl-CoA mutase family protein [Cytophagaceae bacterium YF14B1]|uniref:Methylmalonyl-CoA mutase family protein n=1 Tax=Xanthocytophaga flava TaxID=3048013 RepID=A0AAE3U722_9BACT|nr:methylmalonyl-CoA mutase family protein [Xanthocytophaga flavus]MDJ1479224.1 methylmalonyl-CoA mutase family protein [Xanthocytophaga flavus]